MKKVLVLSAMFLGSVSFAGDVGTAFQSEQSGGISVTPGELLITTTALILTHNHDHRALFLAAQEDAAIFVASEGLFEKSAVLADAMAQVRLVENMSDMDLARTILLVK